MKILMERAVRTYIAAEGEQGEGAPFLRAQYARVLDALGQRAEAIAVLEAAVSRLQELSPPDGRYTLADARLWLGRARLAAGRPAEAEPHLRYCLDFRVRAQSDDHPQRAVAECDLARALAALGRSTDARRLLDACVPRLDGYGLVEPSLRAAARALRDELGDRPADGSSSR